MPYCIVPLYRRTLETPFPRRRPSWTSAPSSLWALTRRARAAGATAGPPRRERSNGDDWAHRMSAKGKFLRARRVSRLPLQGPKIHRGETERG
jgi:hypothetical protein